MNDLRDVPVTVVTGGLGIGKTTTLLHLLRHRPDGARWAVVVNEFGEVGIDGAVLDVGGGLTVREIPGGCICCTSGPLLGVHLVRLLREVRPDRLLIEPTGLAMPGSVIDLLRRPGIADAVSLRATLTLVDPVRFVQGRWRDDPAAVAQVQAADVLVANRCDLATPAQVQAFRDAATALWPAPLAVEAVSHGQVDPAWLDLSPRPGDASPRHHQHHHHHHHEEAGSLVVGADGVGRARHQGEQATAGWIFPPEQLWDREALLRCLQELALPCDALPAGALRIKGIFRTPGAWLLAQVAEQRVSFSPVQYRRDSRVDVIAPASPAPDWDAVERALVGCRAR